MDALLFRTLITLASMAPLVWPAPPTRRANAPERPHIVFILIDDLGWNNLGFMPGEGSEAFLTPRIDALAKESLVFYHAYANASNCAPSRGAWMSGMWAQRTGMYSVKSTARGPVEDRKLLTPANREWLAGDVTTLAEILRGSGYATAHVGKWNLGGEATTLPTAQGFDVNVVGDASGMPATYFDPDGVHLTRYLTDEAIRILEEHEEQRPLFLHMSYFAVHAPYEPEPQLLERARQRLADATGVLPQFAALVDGVDAQIGRLLDALERLDMADDTLLVVTSDNGGPGAVTHQRPLRGSKGMYYEGGLRVPLLVRWPGTVEPGTRSDEPVQLFDFFPTLTAVAKAEVPERQPVDGTSLLALLRGEAKALPARALFWHFPAYLPATNEVPGGVRDGWRATPCSVVREGPWKLIEYFEDGHLELYYLERDPGESTNLAQKETARAEALQKKLVDWRKLTDAPVPSEPNPAYR